MDAPVRYVRSRDGTRIAYSVVGDGPVLLHLSVPNLSHIELYPRMAGAREYLARLGRGRTMIRIDGRGTGMSGRDCSDHTAEACADDIEAVLDAARITHCDVQASGARVPAALAFATRRPASIRRMILANPFTVRPTPFDVPADGMLALAESNWDYFLELVVQRSSGRPVKDIPEIMSFVRRCIDQRNHVAAVQARRPEADWLRAASVQSPVLVVDFVNNVHLPDGLVQRFAEQFPSGRYIALPEGAIVPPYGDPSLLLQAIEELYGPDETEASTDQGKVALTSREGEVLRLLVAGKTQPEIARSLVISPATVSGHVVSVYAKIGAHRRAEAVTWAMRNGFG